MNREIKFRAWDGLNLRMIQDYFYINSDGEVWYDTDPHGVDMSGKKKILFTDRLIVMQFTGLKENAYEQDELNKGVYEGDIIEFISGERLSVEWNDDTCQWQYSDGSPINDGDRYSTHKKIIGNIFENSELLNTE